MYGGLFAVAVVVITTALAVQAFIFYRNIMINDLSEAVETVGEHIRAGGRTDANTLSKLQIKKNIYVSVWELPRARIFINQNFVARTPMLQLVDFTPERQQNRRALFHLSEDGTFDYLENRFFVRAYMDDAWARYILGILSAVFIVVVFTGVSGAFAVGRLMSVKTLKPVTDMIGLASEISILDLGRRIDVSGPDDEIGLLAKAFNDMIGRLEDAFEKQGRFISDASHELRTPISVIQGYANLLDRWGKDDPEILTESIESIKAETERMGTLVKKLLFLAGYEQNPRRMAAEEVSLNACLHEIIKEIGVMDLDHDVELIEEADVAVVSEYNLIKQALWIFIENSMKYAKDGAAHIVMTVFDDGGAGCVSIKDEGIGIKDEDVPFIFDRFYRGDKSRSQKTPGTGLGLSIADKILEAQKAKIDVSSEWGVGTEVTIRFPKV